MDELQIASFIQPPGRLPVQMAKSDGTALRLLKLGVFAADLIRFAPGKRVATHTHPGNHILVVVSGRGWLTYDGERVALTDGLIYLVPGRVPHAIDAAEDSELTLISIADDHRDAGADDRLEVV